MNLGALARRTERMVAQNSPLILTALGVVGTLTTSYLAGKASFKAAEILDRYENYYPDRGLSNREKFDLIWKLYIPALGVGAGTVACIICANRIGTRRAAAMASAFMLSERAAEEYKTKVIETIGKNKERKIRDEIAQDKTDLAFSKNPQVIVTGTGESLCLDAFTRRTFLSTMETMKKAQNDLNYQLVSGDGYASLNEFYAKIGKLGPVPVGEEVGWNSDRQLELNFTTTIVTDQDGAEKPCFVMEFVPAPKPGFSSWR